MPESLDRLAAELAAEAGRPDDPAEAAARIARDLAALRPDSTARARQAAAARAAGADAPPSAASGRAALDSLPRNRAADAGRRGINRAGRYAKRAGRRAAREVPASSFGRLFTTGLKIALLYFALTHGARILAVTMEGLTGALRWLRDPSAVIE